MPSFPAVAVIIASVLVIMLLMLLWMAVRIVAVRRLKAQWNESAPTAQSNEVASTDSSDPADNKGENLRRGCVALAFFLFFTVGGLVAVYFGYQMYEDSIASETWPVVSGTIISSGVVEIEDDEGTSYKPQVIYEYVANDSNIEGHRITFGQMSYSNYQYAQAIADQYPVGQPVEVHYDPDNPDKAVLEPGVQSSAWIIMGFGDFFALMGLILALVALIAGRKR